MEKVSRARVKVLLLLLVLLMTACGSRLAEDASGQEIYEARCSSCHRSDLSGGIGPALGPGSEAVDRPLEYYQVTITSGKGRMPSFGGSLNDDQISLVIDYIRSVQAPGS